MTRLYISRRNSLKGLYNYIVSDITTIVSKFSKIDRIYNQGFLVK